MGDRLYQPAPGVWDGMRVPTDGLPLLDRPPGWKYEAWDGRLRLEPDWRHEVARWVGPLPSRSAPAGVAIVAVAPDSLAAAVAVADAAFGTGPDFFGWPAAEQRRALTQVVEDALRLEPEWVRRAQRIARDPDGGAVGLLLLREVDGGVALSTVSVLPAWRGRGLATAMFREALAVLPGGTDVRSQWLVANRASAGWHRGAGFEVVPTSVSLTSVLVALRTSGSSPERLAQVADVVEQMQSAEATGASPDPFRFTAPVHCRPASAAPGSRADAPA